MTLLEEHAVAVASGVKLAMGVYMNPVVDVAEGVNKAGFVVGVGVGVWVCVVVWARAEDAASMKSITNMITIFFMDPLLENRGPGGAVYSIQTHPITALNGGHKRDAYDTDPPLTGFDSLRSLTAGLPL